MTKTQIKRICDASLTTLTGQYERGEITPADWKQKADSLLWFARMSLMTAVKE